MTLLTERTGEVVDSSTASPRGFEYIYDAVVVLVKPITPHGTEVDGPGVVGDLLEADDLSLEKADGEDLPVLPVECVVPSDEAEPEGARILERQIR